MSLFMVRGTGDAWWVPTIADPDLKPTPAEIAAGINLSAAINAITGLEPQSNKINVAILKYKQEPQIDGPETFQDVSITIAEDDGTGTDADALARQVALTTLIKGASGFLVLSRTKQGTPIAADKLSVLGASVGSVVPNWSLDANAATTDVRLSPSTPLTPVAVKAA